MNAIIIIVVLIVIVWLYIDYKDSKVSTKDYVVWEAKIENGYQNLATEFWIFVEKGKKPTKADIANEVSRRYPEWAGDRLWVTLNVRNEDERISIMLGSENE